MHIIKPSDYQNVSGGDRLEYDFQTGVWSALFGFAGYACSDKILPEPYSKIWISSLMMGSAGFLAGYAFGAIKYKITDTGYNVIDWACAPAE